jgi:hypothetical protein
MLSEVEHALEERWARICARLLVEVAMMTVAADLLAGTGRSPAS